MAVNSTCGTEHHRKNHHRLLSDIEDACAKYGVVRGEDGKEIWPLRAHIESLRAERDQWRAKAEAAEDKPRATNPLPLWPCGCRGTMVPASECNCGIHSEAQKMAALKDAPPQFKPGDRVLYPLNGKWLQGRVWATSPGGVYVRHNGELHDYSPDRVVHYEQPTGPLRRFFGWSGRALRRSAGVAWWAGKWSGLVLLGATAAAALVYGAIVGGSALMDVDWGAILSKVKEAQP